VRYPLCRVEISLSIQWLGAIREKVASMAIKIKAILELTVSETSLEDGLAEYDELTVEGLLQEVLDKAVACDEIRVKVVEGPNTLEEYDQQQANS
jgi:hypothetical protein